MNEDAEPLAGGTEYVAYEDPTTGEIRIAELAAESANIPAPNAASVEEA